MNKKFAQGAIKRHPDGFGFFIPDRTENTDQPDVYIPRHSMKGVMTNDKVMIEVFPDGKDRFRGEIVRIINRGVKKIVGTYLDLNSEYGMIRDESQAWGTDLKIHKSDSLGARKGELVTVEITQYPDSSEGFQGKVIEKLGSALDPLTDVKRVIIGQHIPHDFSVATLKEAEKFSKEVSAEDIKGRKDLRDLKLITIDGATAKDFDDAIYCETRQEGFRLWVAIADVSHYVQLGSAIDQDAFERGTSVYFPNFVVPMLPEILSNHLCSLNPHVDRLSLVAEIPISYTGEIGKASFYEAVIKSHARVTYGEAQEIVDGTDVEKLMHVKDEILRARDLAKLLMARRFRDGSLDLEIPETQIVLDGAGVPVDMIKSERLFSHRLIEELMLAANIAVAEFLSSRDIPSLYRVHEPPNSEALQTLERYMWNLGAQSEGAATPKGKPGSTFSTGKLQKKLTKTLQDFEGKPGAAILNILTLRSMSQAKYSVENLGHFGLGFEFYSHFTSPIRRYPDLIIHRLLKNQIMPNSKYRMVPEDDLQTAATLLSGCEQRAAKAERQFVAIKKARFMEKHVGEEFDGMISSVTKFGVFVMLRQFEVDGLVRLDNLSAKRLEYDEENLVLTSVQGGETYGLGDPIKIKVLRVDIEAGQVDFKNMALGENAGNSKNRRDEKSTKGNAEGKREEPASLRRVFERRGRSGKPRSKQSGGKDSGRRQERGSDERGKPKSKNDRKASSMSGGKAQFKRKRAGSNKSGDAPSFRRPEEENLKKRSPDRVRERTLERENEPVAATTRPGKLSFKISHSGAVSKKSSSSGKGGKSDKKSSKGLKRFR